MPILDDINRILRDHEKYTGNGGNGSLPIGDMTSARKPISKRDLRQLLILLAQAAGDAGALDEIRDDIEALEGQFITPRQFGAIGNYSADDTAAIDAWLGHGAATGDPLWMGAGVYRYHGKRMNLPRGVIIGGVGGPGIAAYPQRSAEKDKLRPGFKNTLSGAVIVFSGAPSDAPITTTRTDRFASLSPMAYYPHAEACRISGFDMIQDMNVLDAAGVMTTAANDGRATGFDCGMVSKGYGARINVGIFGYFPKHGFVNLASVADGIQDPDYADLSGSTITSGVGVVGAATTAEADGGNTGCKGTGVHVYGSDHHNRADTNPSVPVLYVDGATGGSGSGIRGVAFTASSFRGYANDAIVLGTCDDVSLIGCTTEFSTWPVTGLDASGRIVGGATTGNVTLLGLAATSDLGLAALADAIRGNFTFAQAGEFDTFVAGRGGASVAGAMAAVRLGGNSQNDPYIQMTNNLASSTSGWALLRDISEADEFELRWGGSTMLTLQTDGTLYTPHYRGRVGSGAQTVTLSTGAITVSNNVSLVRVGGGAQNLNTINGNFLEGEKLIIRPFSMSDTITLTHTGGNIRCNGGANIVLTGSTNWIELVFDGTNFRAYPKNGW